MQPTQNSPRPSPGTPARDPGELAASASARTGATSIETWHHGARLALQALRPDRFETAVLLVLSVMNEEILPHSPQPVADRRELVAGGGEPSLARIARFYARHPARWWEMTQRQTKEAFSYLGLGHFTRASGYGPMPSQAFNTWSELKKSHYPKNLPLLIGLLLVYCVLAAMKARWLDQDSAQRTKTLVGPVLGIGCALELFATVTFEANGTAKHLFIFNVAVDICLLLALLSLGDAVAQLWRRRRSAVPD
jgi:hypothetical protein